MRKSAVRKARSYLSVLLTLAIIFGSIGLTSATAFVADVPEDITAASDVLPEVDPDKDPDKDPDVDPNIDPDKDPGVDSDKVSGVDSDKVSDVNPDNDPDVAPDKDPGADPDKDSEGEPGEAPTEPGAWATSAFTTFSSGVPIAAWSASTAGAGAVTSFPATSGESGFANNIITRQTATGEGSFTKATANVAGVTGDAQGSSWAAWSQTITTDMYWRLELYTKGYENVELTFHAYGTATSPANWEAKYSLDGITYQSFSVSKTYTIDITNTAGSATAVTVDLSVLDDEEGPVYVGLFATSAATNANGNNRLCNVKVTGTEASSFDPDQLKAVTITPDSGAVLVGQVLTFHPDPDEKDLPGYKIMYSIDGRGTWHEAAVNNEYEIISLPLTIDVKAVADGKTDSRIEEYIYTDASLTPESIAEWNISSISGSVSSVDATGGDSHISGRAKLSVVGTNETTMAYANGGINRNGWDGKANTAYWLATLSSAGYEEVEVSWRQRSSGGGPGRFTLQYSTDGETWVNADNPNYTVGNALGIGVAESLFTKTLPAGANDSGVLHVRWLMSANNAAGTGNAAATGSTTINNIVISGINTIDNELRHVAVSPDSGIVNISDIITFTPGPGDAIEEGYQIQYNANSGGWTPAADNQYTVTELPLELQVRAISTGDKLNSRAYTYNYDAPPAAIPIAEARALPVSTANVMVEGVVTRAVNTSATNLTSGTLYVQDETGGIAVFHSGITVSTYQEGKKVRVSGTMGNNAGVIQIGGAVVEELSDPLAPVTPEIIDIGGLNTGAYEGRLVMLQNVRLTTIATNSNHMITDATGSTTMRSPFNDGTLPDDRYRVNDYINAIGIASNFNGSRQIQVSALDDLSMGTEPPPPPQLESLAEWKLPTPDGVNPINATDGAEGVYETARLSGVNGTTNVTLSSTANGITRSGWDDKIGTAAWLVKLSSKDFENITVSWQQRSSSTGPRDFRLEYSTDNGATWHPAISPAFSIGNNLGINDDRSFFSRTLTEGAGNMDNLWVRWVLASNNRADTAAATTTIASGGTNGIQNIVVSGKYIKKPGEMGPVSVVPGSGDVPVGQVLTFIPDPDDKDAPGYRIEVATNTGSGWSGYETASGNAYTITGLPLSLRVRANSDTPFSQGRAFTHSYTQAKLEHVIPGATPNTALRVGSSLALTHPVESAIIRYTVNGGPETVYTELIPIMDAMFTGSPERLTIVARATGEGYLDGDPLTFVYSKENSGGEKIYFGQLHSHSTLSDGAGEVEEAFAYARDVAKLDFFSVTDHSNSFAHTEPNGDSVQQILDKGGLDAYNAASESWVRGRKAASDTFRAGQFISFYGYEMTWSGGPGHINTFATDGFASRNNTALNNKVNDAGMRGYYDLLRAAPASISMFNHPGTSFGNFTNFAYYEPTIGQRIPLIEVGNGEGAIGSGGYFPSYGQYDLALDKGWKVAPANNQDNHAGKWGNSNTARTAVWTNDFTLDGIYNAMRSRRVYSTEVSDLQIVYMVNGMPLGTIFNDVPGTANFTAQITNPTAGNTVKEVSLVTNGGARILREAPGTQNYTYNKTMNSPRAGWYYLRVVVATPQGDRIAVTAPVWFGSGALVGFNSLTKSSTIAVTDEEFTITADLFNNETKPVIVDSIEYSVNGELIARHDGLNAIINAEGSYEHQQKYTPRTARNETVEARAVVRLASGDEYTITTEMIYNVVAADKLTYVGIDGAHHNAYVDGQYKDAMSNFTAIAAQRNVRVEVLRTPGAVVAAANNPRYEMLIFNVPDRHTSITDKKFYSQDVIDAVEGFSKRGGTLVVAGLASFSENAWGNSGAGADLADHMAGQQNQLLAAAGSMLRISDDQLLDTPSRRPGGTQDFALHLREANGSYHWDENSPLLEGVSTDQVYSQYSGSTIYAVNPADKGQWNAAPAAAVPSGVTRVVSSSMEGRSDDTHGSMSKHGFPVPKYDGRYMVMSHETVVHGDGTETLVVAAGGSFMSNFEVQVEMENASTLPFSNYNICMHLVNMIAPPLDIIPIAGARRMPSGTQVVVEGVVTSNVYEAGDYNTGFFDSIYAQDQSGGINLFPVASGVEEGQTIRVVGTLSAFQGETQINVSGFEVIDPAINRVTPRTVTTEQAVHPGTTGELIKTEGFVSDVRMLNGVLTQFTVTDASGAGAIVFMNAYITRTVQLPFVQEGAYVSVTGLSSVGENLSSSDFLPRIRVRDRNEITPATVPSGYTVTFLGNGGSPERQTRTVTAPATTVGTLPSVSRARFAFTGWNTLENGMGSEFMSSTPIIGNITVYAQWRSVGGSSSGSSGGSSGSGGSSAPAQQPAGTLSQGSAVSAIASQINANMTGDVVTATFKNISEVSKDVFDAMAKAGKGRTIEARFDSTIPGVGVDVRLYIDPAAVTSGLNVSGSTNNQTAQSTKNKFETFFDNDIAVISLGQQGSFGTEIKVAARVDLTGMDTENLHFYSYDAETNTYRQIPDPNYWVDNNGYLRFTTELAGSIIVSDGPLVRQGQN